MLILAEQHVYWAAQDQLRVPNKQNGYCTRQEYKQTKVSESRWRHL